jgi:hypothetical protein
MLTQSSRDLAGGPAPAASPCCHYWIIQPAMGPVSDGTCRRCGQVREFFNSLPPDVSHRRPLESSRWDLLSDVLARDPLDWVGRIGVGRRTMGPGED